MRVIHDWLVGHDAKKYGSCHAINTRVLIYNANKAVNLYGRDNCASKLVPCKTPV